MRAKEGRKEGRKGGVGRHGIDVGGTKGGRLRKGGTGLCHNHNRSSAVVVTVSVNFRPATHSLFRQSSRIDGEVKIAIEVRDSTG